VVVLEFILRLPPTMVTLTKRLVYMSLFFARPFGSFFFSIFSTLGVCDLTLPARARDPWTLPIFVYSLKKLGEEYVGSVNGQDEG